MADLCTVLPFRKNALLYACGFGLGTLKFKWKFGQHCNLGALSLSAPQDVTQPDCFNPPVELNLVVRIYGSETSFLILLEEQRLKFTSCFWREIRAVKRYLMCISCDCN
jgi:hypothetical protein